MCTWKGCDDRRGQQQRRSGRSGSKSLPLVEIVEGNVAAVVADLDLARLAAVVVLLSSWFSSGCSVGTLTTFATERLQGLGAIPTCTRRLRRSLSPS